jgi:hypothetical protein
MAGLSGAGETIVLNALLAARFVSLHTADPGATGTSEVTGTPYTRIAATFTNTGSDPTIAANSAVIQFPTATSLWGTVSFFGLWSAVTAGTFLGGWPVNISKVVDVEDTARWDVGQLKIGTDELIP